jgi:transposase
VPTLTLDGSQGQDPVCTRQVGSVGLLNGHSCELIYVFHLCPVGIGIDISKAKLDCSLLLDVASGKRKSKSVANSKSGVIGLLAWCTQQTVVAPDLHASMEGTGSYHEQPALALFDAGVTVSIVNPAQVKDFGKSLGIRTKTDGIDSLILAKYAALLNPKPWLPPTQEARELQALLSRREAIAQDLQRERNRLEKTETTELSPLIQQSILDTIAFLEQQLEKLQRNIDQHIDKHPNLKKDRDLLTSIPAVGPQVGNHMLAVLHTHPFRSAEQFAAYLGLVPVERQSGSSLKGRPRLSKTGPAHLRAKLYMAVVLATRHNPHLKNLYQRLQANGKSKMSALGAVMRKLAHLCFGVLKTRMPYQPNFPLPC